jgi:ATP-binding cassette subfamily B protein
MIETDDTIGLKESKNVIIRLVKYAKPYRLKVFLSLGFLLITTLITLAGPQIVAYVINHGISAKTLGVLYWPIGLYVGLGAINFVLSKYQGKFMSTAGEALLRDLRARLFSHIQDLPLSFYESYPTGRLVARMTSDFDAMEDLVQQGLGVFVTNGLLIFVALIVLPIYCWQLFLLVFLTLPPLVLLTIWFQKASKNAYLIVRDKISQTLTSLQESITGVNVVQAYSRQDHAINKFARYNDAQLKANLKAVKLSIRYFPVLELTGVVTTGLLILLGGFLSYHHVIELGKVVAFILYLGALYSPIQQIGQLFNQFQSSGAALDKILNILDTESSLKNPINPETFNDNKDLELLNVSFTYNDKDIVLKDVNLKIPYSKRLALVGPTGAGKSTLAKLIARFYDPTSGEVLYGGVSLRNVTIEDLRKKINMVPQEGYLFDGTIYDNIAIVKQNCDKKEIYELLEKLHCLDRFLSFKDGLDTEILERGQLLSAGERQLISIARAGLCNPEVIILDEATSNLDPGTERLIENAFNELSRDKTVIVIAHRLSTAERADLIAVVDNGEIVELGTHQDLLNEKKKYFSMYMAWNKTAA